MAETRGTSNSPAACEVSCRARRGFAAAIVAVRPRVMGPPSPVEEVRPESTIAAIVRHGAHGAPRSCRLPAFRMNERGRCTQTTMDRHLGPPSRETCRQVGTWADLESGSCHGPPLGIGESVARWYHPGPEPVFGPVGMRGFDRAWLSGSASRGCCSGLVNKAAKRSTWQPPVDSRSRRLGGRVSVEAASASRVVEASSSGAAIRMSDA